MMYTMNKKKRLKIVKLGVDNTCSVLYNGTYKLKKMGTITKIKINKCQVDINGRLYSVPMSMLEVA